MTEWKRLDKTEFLLNMRGEANWIEEELIKMATLLWEERLRKEIRRFYSLSTTIFSKRFRIIEARVVVICQVLGNERRASRTDTCQGVKRRLRAVTECNPILCPDGMDYLHEWGFLTWVYKMKKNIVRPEAMNVALNGNQHSFCQSRM